MRIFKICTYYVNGQVVVDYEKDKYIQRLLDKILKCDIIRIVIEPLE